METFSALVLAFSPFSSSPCASKDKDSCASKDKDPCASKHHKIFMYKRLPLGELWTCPLRVLVAHVASTATSPLQHLDSTF